MLKHQILDKEGVPSDQRNLVYLRRQLEDSLRLCNYEIQQESTVELLLRLRAGMLRPVNQESGEVPSAGGQLTTRGQLAAHIPLPGYQPREGVEDSGVSPDPMDASDSTSLVTSGGGAIVEVPLERYALLGWEQMLFACPTFHPALEFSVPLVLPSPLGF